MRAQPCRPDGGTLVELTSVTHWIPTLRRGAEWEDWDLWVPTVDVHGGGGTAQCGLRRLPRGHWDLGCPRPAGPSLLRSLLRAVGSGIGLPGGALGELRSMGTPCPAFSGRSS